MFKKGLVSIRTIGGVGRTAGNTVQKARSEKIIQALPNGLSPFFGKVKFNGIAFETQGGAFMNPDTLLEAAKQLHEIAANQ